MKLKVEYYDGQNTTNHVFDLTYLQFIKHLAFAGMGVHTSPYNMFRFLGFWIEFFPYWKTSANGFHLPKVIYNDPTEHGQISNRIGKAFADFLAKKIYKAKYTHNFEDLMASDGYKIKGERPDLYCDSLTTQFAIEAKGYTRKSISNKEMDKFKRQAKETWPISVHFSVASVAYNLYKDIEDQKQFAIKVKDFAFIAVLFQARKQKENPVHVLHQQRIQYRIDLIRKFVEEV